MSLYLINETEETPLIDFNFDEGVFVIKGKSTMKNPVKFYAEILDQLSSQNNFNTPIRLVLDFDFFNIRSSKEILKIIYIFNSWHEMGYNVKVIWNYNQFDDHMEELGNDFAFMVKVPFEFQQCSLEFSA